MAYKTDLRVAEEFNRVALMVMTIEDESDQAAPKLELWYVGEQVSNLRPIHVLVCPWVIDEGAFNPRTGQVMQERLANMERRIFETKSEPMSYTEAVRLFETRSTDLSNIY